MFIYYDEVKTEVMIDLFDSDYILLEPNEEIFCNTVVADTASTGILNTIVGLIPIVGTLTNLGPTMEQLLNCMPNHLWWGVATIEYGKSDSFSVIENEKITTDYDKIVKGTLEQNRNERHGDTLQFDSRYYSTESTPLADSIYEVRFTIPLKLKNPNLESDFRFLLDSDKLVGLYFQDKNIGEFKSSSQDAQNLFTPTNSEDVLTMDTELSSQGDLSGHWVGRLYQYGQSFSSVNTFSYALDLEQIGSEVEGTSRIESDSYYAVMELSGSLSNGVLSFTETSILDNEIPPEWYYILKEPTLNYINASPKILEGTWISNEGYPGSIFLQKI
jgi:hypothetical protein